MKHFSEKIYLTLTPPTEEEAGGDQQRIEKALSALGYDPVKISLHALQQLYPMCRECGYHLTATLVYRESDWILTHLEPGDTRCSYP